MLEAYRQHVEERAAEGVPPKPLTAEQVAALIAERPRGIAALGGFFRFTVPHQINLHGDILAE